MNIADNKIYFSESKKNPDTVLALDVFIVMIPLFNKDSCDAGIGNSFKCFLSGKLKGFLHNIGHITLEITSISRNDLSFIAISLWA